jgi:hypothetical protein
MTDILMILGAVALPIVWFALSQVAYARLNRYGKRRLLRCPETTGIAVVDVVRKAQSRSTTDSLTVETCQLWPEKQNCARGCLSRCRWGSYGFDLSSLMNHDIKQNVSVSH